MAQRLAGVAAPQPLSADEPAGGHRVQTALPLLRHPVPLNELLQLCLPARAPGDLGGGERAGGALARVAGAGAMVQAAVQGPPAGGRVAGVGGHPGGVFVAGHAAGVLAAVAGC